MFLNAVVEESRHRQSTITSRSQAVERVISFMKDRLDEPLSLDTMAEIANLSPYHFNRVFREVTGIPPTQFHYALRLDIAKKLLLTTDLSVTDVCFEVGYNSLGTFTMRFTKLVGLSPLHMRQFAKGIKRMPPPWLAPPEGETHPTLLPTAGPRGFIKAPSNFSGLIFVGLFASSIPQSQPVACALLSAPGAFHLPSVPDGRYYLFAAACSHSGDLLKNLLNDSALRGCAGPLVVRRGQLNHSTNLELRPAKLTDPPLLISLPLLLMQHRSPEGFGLRQHLRKMNVSNYSRNPYTPALVAEG